MRGTVTQGVTGMGLGFGSAWLTLSNVEWGIRVTGGLVGIVTGFFMMLIVIRKWRAGKDVETP